MNGTPAAWLRESRLPRVAVLAAPNRPRVASELPKLLPYIEQHAEIVTVDSNFEHDFSDCKSDLVIVLGGDGSILQSARQMQNKQRPVLGVNLGKLGFLAAITPESFVAQWSEIASGRFDVTKHLMLSCEVYRDQERLHSMLGLNEASILGGPPYSMMHIDLNIDSVLATTYACDGLIISTPIGSTAHNLSAGGPILRRNLEAFVICPISPHTLTMRPVVDTADRVFELRLRTEQNSASVVVDGRVVCHLDESLRVRIARADSVFQLISVPGHDDYQALRDKLGWSGRPRLAE